MAADGAWLVVGLGNPGPRYADHRHNVGAMVADRLAADLGGRFSAHRSQSAVLETRLAPVSGVPGARLILAKPAVYMNLSGGPVAGLARFYRISPDRLLVVHDELDLPFGQVRLKRGGGEAGHNGLRSISQSLSTRDYCRLRIGIGRPPGRQDPADFVLRGFTAAEREELPFAVDDAVAAITAVLEQGWDRAMNQVNTKSK